MRVCVCLSSLVSQVVISTSYVGGRTESLTNVLCSDRAEFLAAWRLGFFSVVGAGRFFGAALASLRRGPLGQGFARGPGEGQGPPEPLAVEEEAAAARLPTLLEDSLPSR